MDGFIINRIWIYVVVDNAPNGMIIRLGAKGLTCKELLDFIDMK